VHGVVDLYLGAANKNIGDAFLLVWKFNDGDIIRDSKGVSLDMDSPYVHQIADLALIAFIKINVKVNRDPKCLKYRTHKILNERMKNYSIKMGFGLHVGWAIEGAIGSEFKIDASYLSPNVNMASRLEAATK
jgi:class 3 adenylate cyclase